MFTQNLNIIKYKGQGALQCMQAVECWLEELNTFSASSQTIVQHSLSVITYGKCKVR